MNQHSTVQQFLIIGLNFLGLDFHKLLQTLAGLAGLTTQHFVVLSWYASGRVEVKTTFPFQTKIGKGKAIQGCFGTIFQFKDGTLVYFGNSGVQIKPNTNKWEVIETSTNTVGACITELGLESTGIVGALSLNANGSDSTKIVTVYMDEQKIIDYILSAIYRVNRNKLATQIACTAMQNKLE